MSVLILLLLFIPTPPLQQAVVSAAQPESPTGFRTYIDTGIRDEFYLSDLNYGYNQITGDLYIHFWRTGVLVRFTESGRFDTLATLDFGPGEDPRRLDVSSDGASLLFWPKGLGPVHRFDLSDRSLTRLDESKLYGLAHGHVSLLMPNGRLLAYGGYGYWEYRDLFLYFDPQTKGWFEMPAFGDVPDLVRAVVLAHAIDLDRYVLIGFTDRADRILKVYEYDPDTAVWEFVAHSQLNATPFEIFGPGVQYNTPRTHTYNPLTGDLVITSKLLYNTRSRTFSTYQVQDAPRITSPMVFYSMRWKSWVLFELDYTSFTNAFVFATVNLGDLRAISRPAWLHYIHVVLPWIGVIAGLLGTALLTASIVRRSASSATRSKDGRMVIRNSGTQEGDVRCWINAEELPLQDVHLRKLIQLLAEMKERGEPRRMLSDVDQVLFPAMSSSSYTTKVKNRLFEMINHQAGKAILKVEKSRTDKRYKVLTLELEDVEIE